MLLLAVAFSAVLAPRAPIARQVQRDDKPAPRPAGLIEKGKFRLHKVEQPIGEETYQITRDGASLTVTMAFKFNDRGTDVPLSATFRCSSDLTPRAFEIKGKTARLSTIDEAVEVQAGKARLRNRGQWTEATPPSQFFTIAGYAPSTMQMLMVRYWASHGSTLSWRRCQADA